MSKPALPTNTEPPSPRDKASVPRKALTPEAERALAEAAARRVAADAALAIKPKEFGGQAGPDPIRYGDWEKSGIVSDF